MANIINSEVTYSALISTAANKLALLLKNQDISSGTFQQIVSEKFGDERYQWSEIETRTGSYVSPTEQTLRTDITKFMNALGIPTTGSTASIPGLVSFYFALQFFAEKAVIKKIVSSLNGVVTYHIHYQYPGTSGYTKLPTSYTNEEMVTNEKVNDIYNQLSVTSMISGNARKTDITASQSCSSSSSSCSSSSSSSSSSSFIIYFNLK